ncbi:leucine-rich repeat domain-containing protein [Candidatus Cytomitobacter indipagum]|uniref:Leucine-rich repeat domain-containing protein n=1 Tax=Candidatus Cytomitobacter indipagum TaxID=2601575 RepID=A0A5C0UDB0_9PROT|nr:leucine-rich repeat domain-containing protein [Candidatus Cytomitobacter indipagum]QEK37968.1 leucine-rich repeat domain-containing protein [Candidatus Cytomitobacter indipagum]
MNNATMLDLSYNQITSTKSEIFEGLNLEAIDPHHNKITSFELRMLIRIKQFDNT